MEYLQPRGLDVHGQTREVGSVPQVIQVKTPCRRLGGWESALRLNSSVGTLNPTETRQSPWQFTNDRALAQLLPTLRCHLHVLPKQG